MATTSRLSVHPSLSKDVERFQDPLVNELRLIRSQLSARFQNNLADIAKDLMKRQKNWESNCGV